LKQKSFSVCVNVAVKHFISDGINQLWNSKHSILRVCLYSHLSYRACKSHLSCIVLYCHLWPVRLYNIFPRYLIYGTAFGNNLFNIKYVF
jgi:hypothetical protein